MLSHILSAAVKRPTWLARRRTTTQLCSRFDPDSEPLLALESFLRQRASRVKCGTLAKDISHLKWIFPRLTSHNTSSSTLPLLDDLSRGLRHMGALDPTCKALPLSLPALRRLSRAVCPKIRCLLILAFRTASRVSDLANLTPSDFIFNRRERTLLIQFRITKCNQSGQRRPDHKILLSDPEHEILSFLLQRHPKNKPLFQPRDFASLRQSLRRLPVSNNELVFWKNQTPDEIVRDHYTFHSIKRGAAALLWEACADGVVSVADLLLHLKHKDIESALQYCPVPLLAARAVGSRASHVTRLHPRSSPPPSSQNPIPSPSSRNHRQHRSFFAAIA